LKHESFVVIRPEPQRTRKSIVLVENMAATGFFGYVDVRRSRRAELAGAAR
jgi:hypothetical protein